MSEWRRECESAPKHGITWLYTLAHRGADQISIYPPKVGQVMSEVDGRFIRIRSLMPSLPQTTSGKNS